MYVRLFLCFILLLPTVAWGAPESEAQKILSAWCGRNAVEQASAVLVGGGQPPRFVNVGKSTQTTPYILASCSKSFTALAIAQLIHEKKIGLDEPVLTYLPYWRVADQSGEKVTIRHLLCHASGLPRSAGQRRYSGKLEEGVRALAEVPLLATPGHKHEYSNANYMVLGCVVETETGEAFADYVKARILRPLGMNLSEVGTYYGRSSMETCKVPSAGVASTTEDLALYLKAQLGAPNRAIPPEIALQSALLPKIEYGFGWYCDPAATWANHSGEFFGGLGNFHSFAALRPKQNKGFMVLSKLRKGAPAPNWHELEPLLLRNCP